MLILSYAQWKESMINTFSLSEIVECPACDGEGVTHTECDCCGHEREECCDLCEESGKVKFGDLSEQEANNYLTKRRYMNAIVDDIAALASWQGIDKIPLMIKAGFTVYCSLHKKEIVIPIE